MVNINANDLRQLILDVKLMKEILLSGKLYYDYEGELSDWAKKELAEARETPNSELLSSEEVEKELSPSDKQLVDLTISKVKSNNFEDMITFEELSKEIGE